MADYPKDEFDDLPATGRKGAHRRDGGPTSQAGALALIAILAIAALLLVFGAINIIRTSAGDPEEKIAEPTATAEPTSEETTEEPSVDIDAVEKTAAVAVLNASGVSGAGSAFGEAVEGAGWTVAQVGNHTTADTVSSIHYSDPEFEAEAQALAELLGVTDVEESEEFTDDITVVVCSDIANDPPTADGAAEDPGA
ncbi:MULTISPECIES: LytR C-terminal domain-containing protein [Brevibacterium]|uniref:LytR/CpsA/Psr regulator C-terminal domain-containing protein n=1 Tax=Brevibacterium pityocampae TaxID=506594 RepID=A0ABP8J468_9MICO|nr:MULTISPECIES: LytR C-terminal domain-containing protein [Actinomycetes]MCX0275995.1 LytR C-terminal domain-containing protein [Nocardia zapadnayensis]QCP04936.1 LytR family transcriptional regulator [Brevibacterium sp. CS2]